VELVLRSGDAMFKGKVNRAHTKMTGHVIQDGHSARVTLRRADEGSGKQSVVRGQ
jgi:hypothetical protein